MLQQDDVGSRTPLGLHGCTPFPEVKAVRRWSFLLVVLFAQPVLPAPTPKPAAPKRAALEVFLIDDGDFFVGQVLTPAGGALV